MTLLLGAGAAVARVGRSVLTAGTGVARHHDHPAGGVGRGLLTTGDRHLTALEGLTQRVDDVAAEQRELVEEQHATVGPAHLAGAHPPGAAAEEAGLARVVMGREERRGGGQGGPPPPGGPPGGGRGGGG